ncbi:hypothetical protein DVP60_05240 [Yersinia enterocolitica]|nr:hypothetical protein [Yersinia enterocolitica]EKN5087740.1 hypothetical protein [Yersinia enterocolitica]EKN5909214.1 hypothetical protein [Yersinia enterocolitica]EKN5920659.1 hypothetical protein [Yersinia enterocolitica]EKN5934710.1 hypothetical protein [Yersinia enterocolitica]
MDGAARAPRDGFTASLRSTCFHRYGHFVINLTRHLSEFQRIEQLNAGFTPRTGLLFRPHPVHYRDDNQTHHVHQSQYLQR